MTGWGGQGTPGGIGRPGLGGRGEGLVTSEAGYIRCPLSVPPAAPGGTAGTLGTVCHSLEVLGT